MLFSHETLQIDLKVSSSTSVRNKMEDIKISQEELEEVRSSRSKTRSNTRQKGFYSKSSRPTIRFKLVDLDFSLKLGDIQDLKTRPLFFSGSDGTSRRNGRQICDILSEANYKTAAEIGDGDSKFIPGDLTTKMLGGTHAGRSPVAETHQGNFDVARQKEHDGVKYDDGDSKTILRNLETRIPRTLRLSAARTLYRHLIARDVTTKMQKIQSGTIATHFTPCTLRTSAAGALYRNFYSGDARINKSGETVAAYFTLCTLRSSAARTLSRNLNPGDVRTRMQKRHGGTVATCWTPRTLRSYAAGAVYRNLNPGDVTTKMSGEKDATHFTPCSLRWSAAETIYRNLNPGAVRTKMPGETVAPYFTPSTLSSSAAGTLYRILNVVRQRGNQGNVNGNIYERTTYKNGATNMVDKSKSENIIAATQVKPASSGTIPEIEISEKIISHQCQDTKDITDANTSNSTVPSAMAELRPLSDTTGEQETPRTKKRQNFLKKFWKRITRKSKNKTESKKDNQEAKTLKKSSKLTSLMCLCQPRTLD